MSGIVEELQKLVVERERLAADLEAATTWAKDLETRVMGVEAAIATARSEEQAKTTEAAASLAAVRADLERAVRGTAIDKIEIEALRTTCEQIRAEHVASAESLGAERDRHAVTATRLALIVDEARAGLRAALGRAGVGLPEDADPISILRAAAHRIDDHRSAPATVVEKDLRATRLMLEDAESRILSLERANRAPVTSDR